MKREKPNRIEEILMWIRRIGIQHDCECPVVAVSVWDKQEISRQLHIDGDVSSQVHNFISQQDGGQDAEKGEAGESN